MSMQSNVGNSQIYEANEQRPQKMTGPEQGIQQNAGKAYDIAPSNAHHDLDSKDERSLANRLGAAEKHSREQEGRNEKTVTDPLKPAMDHGNQPSRGARIDAELQREDEELLKKKDQ